jgi:probable HAF family extracellular repeat protein
MSYTMLDLGTLGGGGARAYGIDDTGRVVGDASTPDGQGHAFLYDQGMMVDLGTLGGRLSTANAINRSGQIVGDSTLPGDTGEYHAFLYDQGTMTDLGTLDGSFSAALGINDGGLVVGYTTVQPFGEHAFLYDGTMNDLGTLGSINSMALGINNSGQVVGWSGSRAFLWDKANGMQDLLGPLGIQDSAATAINDAGQIVGEANGQAFFYDQGKLTHLGWLDDMFPLSIASSLNDAGVVVGSAPVRGHVSYHGFVYADGVLTDLNELVPPSGLTIREANAINNAGQIVGIAQDSTGFHEHAVLLTPDEGEISARIHPSASRAHPGALGILGPRIGGGTLSPSVSDQRLPPSPTGFVTAVPAQGVSETPLPSSAARFTPSSTAAARHHKDFLFVGPTGEELWDEFSPVGTAS